jgi:hypothetical protein
MTRIIESLAAEGTKGLVIAASIAALSAGATIGAYLAAVAANH